MGQLFHCFFSDGYELLVRATLMISLEQKVTGIGLFFDLSEAGLIDL